MAKQHWKGSVLLAPVPPTLVSCGTMEHPNVLTIAWTGVLATHPPMTYISVRPSRYSYDLIRESGEFVINLPTSAISSSVVSWHTPTGNTSPWAESWGTSAIPSGKRKSRAREKDSRGRKDDFLRS